MKERTDFKVKLPAHRAGLPGKEDICFSIAPLIPACKAEPAACASGQPFFPIKSRKDDICDFLLLIS
jgi:hypothetical protein